MHKYIPAIGIVTFIIALILVPRNDDVTSSDVAGQNQSASVLTSQNSSQRSSQSDNSQAEESFQQTENYPEQSYPDRPAEMAEDLRSPMQNQLAEVAEAYSYNARFPPYSQPLAESDWSALNPRAFTPSERPLSNAPSLKVAIQLPQYVLDRNRDLPVTVVVASEGDSSNSPMIKATGGQVLIQHSAGTTAAVPLASATQQGNVETFVATIPATELSSFVDTEVTVAAQLKLSDGQSSTVTAVAQLYQSTANLDYLGSAYVDGAHLVIPAHFDVISPGYYRVQANLFSESGIPVSHLNASFLLSSDNGIGLMKVHATTLREKGIAGPYVLTDINVMRMPSAPGEQTQYGSASETSYPVAGFPLTSYSEEPYQDAATQQRIEFLQKLSGEQL
ncbi:hypothetical protein [Alcanivorax sp. 1008]|uniref:hypothetical protein n=1 Tax=Alcanivorax sp. 1008 TaxID=2816853 RepID=UPI001D1B7FE3|nr:hypothetical protein [Alcanivorax sp. 1008]MCC1497838.1 hypothetical protein [Alcanivorax sp. 1008]